MEESMSKSKSKNPTDAGTPSLDPQAAPTDAMNAFRRPSRHTLTLAHDDRAGIRLLKHHRFKQTQLRFERKVPHVAAQRLYLTGWVWRPAEGVFTRQFGNQGEAVAIDEARRLFDALCRELLPAQTEDAPC
jgi:hypothetical protein